MKFNVFFNCPKPFFAFFIFLLQKDFDILRMLLCGVFLCVFDNSYLSSLYIEKKCIKKMHRLNHSKNHLNCFRQNIFVFKNFSKLFCE